MLSAPLNRKCIFIIAAVNPSVSNKKRKLQFALEFIVTCGEQMYFPHHLWDDVYGRSFDAYLKFLSLNKKIKSNSSCGGFLTVIHSIAD